jgi:signal transduction histidine kinase
VVFRNLLQNAIKYTPENGRITWHITTENHYLHSTLTDNGQGIDPADQAHIFERFYRADKAHTREIPGSGLGLPLSKLIIELYGGKIKIHSLGYNQGTTAEVWWPLP